MSSAHFVMFQQVELKARDLLPHRPPGPTTGAEPGQVFSFRSQVLKLTRTRYTASTLLAASRPAKRDSSKVLGTSTHHSRQARGSYPFGGSPPARLQFSNSTVLQLGPKSIPGSLFQISPHVSSTAWPSIAAQQPHHRLPQESHRIGNETGGPVHPPSRSQQQRAHRHWQARGHTCRGPVA